ncbi:hypothetical protein [Synechococcus phage S-N03]|uniref:Uncharacterized protein n=1 Tax=Synechococcus phage S-N03 TaxID=2718943 RepID=A0A6G8R601_9CAUD|nr:hypothetical protein PQC09_gp247 [Synechococcus phage S-N03]QIN96820.1 hypothetical protein [Synechococcus phage S-N03]
MNFKLTSQEFAVVMKALDHLRFVETPGNDEERINDLRDKLAFQFTQGLDKA